MNGTYIKTQKLNVSVDRIKRLSTEILNEYQDKFGTDFSSNKQLLNEVSIIRSKGLKNEIAGYITKILQRKQKFEERKQQLIDSEKESSRDEPQRKISKREPAAEPSAEPAAEMDFNQSQEETIAEEIVSDADPEQKL